MKFEKSLFEDRYNEYWNKNVVGLDDTIRGISLGFSLFHNESNIPALMKKYQQHVQNIISNIDRQTDMFTDKNYVQQYKKDTIEQSVSDLDIYGRLFPQYEHHATNIIANLRQLLADDNTTNMDYTF